MVSSLGPLLAELRHPHTYRHLQLHGLNRAVEEAVSLQVSLWMLYLQTISGSAQEKLQYLFPPCGYTLGGAC